MTIWKLSVSVSEESRRLLVEMIRSGVSDPVRNNGDLWPLLYLPSLVGVLIAVGQLVFLSFPVKLRRKVAV